MIMNYRESVGGVNAGGSLGPSSSIEHRFPSPDFGTGSEEILGSRRSGYITTHERMLGYGYQTCTKHVLYAGPRIESSFGLSDI